MNDKEKLAVIAMLKRHNVGLAGLMKAVMRLAKDANDEAQKDVKAILSEMVAADKGIKDASAAMRAGEAQIDDEGFAPAGFYL